jgi:MFS family permease
VRWLVAAVATNLHVVYAVQVLHGVTVAGLIIGGPLYVDAVVPAKLRSTAQGALSMMGMGVGGIVSNVGSGVLIDAVGAKAPALIGGAGAALLTVVMWWLVPRAPAAKSPAPEPRASAEIV